VCGRRPVRPGHGMQPQTHRRPLLPCRLNSTGLRGTASGTASTAVGTARGTQRQLLRPSLQCRALARFMVYKVCWFKDLTSRCSDVDILAAFDDALRDGVHMVSASLGSTPPLMPRAVRDEHRDRVVPRDADGGRDGALGGERQAGRGDGAERLAVGDHRRRQHTIDRRFPTVITLGNDASVVVSFLDVPSLFGMLA
jgi:hypothetical protein